MTWRARGNPNHPKSLVSAHTHLSLCEHNLQAARKDRQAGTRRRSASASTHSGVALRADSRGRAHIAVRPEHVLGAEGGPEGADAAARAAQLGHHVRRKIVRVVDVELEAERIQQRALRGQHALAQLVVEPRLGSCAIILASFLYLRARAAPRCV